MFRSAASLAAALLLGACSQKSEAPVGGATDTASQTPASLPVSIPAGMRGRWGLAPADCEPNRADAKGLMTVDGKTLGFYEARGVLGAVSAGDTTHLRAVFAMTGEGMRWNREQTFVLDPAGDTLVRHEFGQDAIPAPLTYHRCPDVIDVDRREKPPGKR